MNICKNCGTGFEGNFCPKCGTKHIQMPTSLACTRCGAIWPIGTNFCTNCGNALGVVNNTNNEKKNPLDKLNNISLDNSQLAKIGMYVLCWIMLGILILVALYAPAYEVEIYDDDDEWTLYEWNMMLYEDLEDEMDDYKDLIEDYEEDIEYWDEYLESKGESANYSMVKEKQADIQEKIEMCSNELNTMRIIWWGNVIFGIILIMTLVYNIYAYIAKVNNRYDMIQGGEVFSYMLIVMVIVNYVFILLMRSASEERYEDEISIETMSGVVALIILAIVNAKVILGMYNRVLYYSSGEDKLDKLEKVAKTSTKKSVSQGGNGWRCSVCGCVNADYVGSCKCGNSRYSR